MLRIIQPVFDSVKIVKIKEPGPGQGKKMLYFMGATVLVPNIMRENYAFNF